MVFKHTIVTTSMSTLINSTTACIQVGDSSCDVLITRYPNQLLVIVTCTGTLGTILQATTDSIDTETNLYDITTLLGKREDHVHDLCCRRLAGELAQAGVRLPLQLCLGIPSVTVEDVRPLVPQLVALVQQLEAPGVGATPSSLVQ